MKILYEDNHLLILEKAAGIPMQVTQHSEQDLESLAKLFIKKRDHKPGAVFLHAVHRLDKPVSGIAVFAKTTKALQRLNASLRSSLFKKTYYAVVEGIIAETGILEHYLFHGHFRADISISPKDGYKKASLTFRRVRTGPDWSLVEVSLISGRYHQIRAQFSFIGHPIFFDVKYHSSKNGINAGILLHHSKVEFPHPVNKNTLVIESPYHFFDK